MTPEQRRRVEELYFMLASAHPSQRNETLSDPALDPEVAAEVRSLLAAQPSDLFLNTPVLDEGSLSRLVGGGDAPDSLIGARVGPWRIDRLLGAGGMGAVYLASRADGAFEGHAALKVVKRGMDTDEILRRFRDERRTLANLRHPNIAAVQDAGSLPDGRPYLVMEYVDGLPLTQYCRDRNLSTADRLHLLIQVCRAVQFAHQNLVVHRDIKPGNILVTPTGTPKLLDFGIAKVIPAGGTAAAVTELQDRRITPEYASPEQIAGRPATTTADTYSLGVVLYELLCGRQPFEFVTRTPEEVQRIVCETLPPSPSTAAARSADARRDLSPQRLARELRGDLDTIALMALRKEPDRRYQSAELLAADLEAYLAGRPVSARKDTFLYRSTKFVRRHRLTVSAAALALASLIAGMVFIQRQRDEAFIARDQAEAIAKFIHDTLASADPAEHGPGATVQAILDGAAGRIGAELADQPRVRAAVRSTIGSAYLGLGLYEKAEEQIRAAYRERTELLGPGHHDTAESMLDLASICYHRREFAEAERLLRGALDIFRRIRGDHNADVARTLSSLGAVLRSLGKVDEAALALQESIDFHRRADAGPSLQLAESLNNYAGILRARREMDRAEETLTEALRIRRSFLRPDHPLVIQSVSNLAGTIGSRGDMARAEPLYREAMALADSGLPADHPDRAIVASSLANLLVATGKAAEAEPLARAALAARLKHLAPTDPRITQSRLLIARALDGQGRTTEAAAALEGLLQEDAAGTIDPGIRANLRDVAAGILQRAGDPRAPAYRVPVSATARPGSP